MALLFDDGTANSTYSGGATPFGANFVYVVAFVPLLAIMWAAAGSVALIMGIVAARRRAWRLAVSYFIFPLTVLAVFSAPYAVLRNLNYAGSILHFAIMLPSYQARVDALPSTDEPKLVVFNLGGMIWFSTGFVYDESDEIMRPEADRTAAWTLRANRAELGCGFVAGQVWEHFYLADFNC